LAPGEVLAQVGGYAQVHSPPEIARFRLAVLAHGNSDPAARAACAAALRDLLAKLKAIGVPAAAITVLPAGNETRIGFIGNAAYGDEDEDIPAVASAAAAMTRQRKTATTGVQIELTDLSRLAAVRQLLLEDENVAAQPAALTLRDDRAARRAATAQAIVKAKEQADAYSSALGLRVVRIVRVFDPNANSEQPQVWAQMMAMMNGGTGSDVVTDARVGLDVVLAPR
jgi:uncharacterized protein YggE